MGGGGGGKINNFLDPLGIILKDDPPAAPPAPEPLPSPAVMPVEDDEASRRAQKRRRSEIAQRGGRISTILTEQSGGGLGA